MKSWSLEQRTGLKLQHKPPGGAEPTLRQHCCLSAFRLTDCVYMLEHNHVMNVLNEDWIHVNSFIRSASPKGSSQDRISEVDTIAGLEPVLVGYLPACAIDRIVGSSRPAHAREFRPGISPGSGRRQRNK